MQLTCKIMFQKNTNLKINAENNKLQIAIDANENATKKAKKKMAQNQNQFKIYKKCVARAFKRAANKKKIIFFIKKLMKNLLQKKSVVFM